MTPRDLERCTTTRRAGLHALKIGGGRTIDWAAQLTDELPGAPPGARSATCSPVHRQRRVQKEKVRDGSAVPRACTGVAAGPRWKESRDVRDGRGSLGRLGTT